MLVMETAKIISAREAQLNSHTYILLTKVTATQNEVTLRYHRVCGLYFLAVIFAATIVEF